MGPQPKVRKPRLGSYAVFLGIFVLLQFLGHLPLIGLPYFWDEVGFYIPAALDIFHGGAWIPHSVAPIVHPPGVEAYLAAAWSVAGYHFAATRAALLLLSAFGLLAAFLLAIELSKGVMNAAPAFLAVGLLCCSPLFFAQSMLAHLDAPAMVFTTLALLLFLQDRILLSAGVCVALVMVKETGLLAPLLFAAWLARERRWRDAAWFAVPAVVLAAWIGALIAHTGHWTGDPGYQQYNVFYPLHPVRLPISILRRLYTLFFANFHWIGTFAILYAWRTSSLFRGRSWKVCWSLVGGQVLLVSVFGGAVLERYLVPVLPILYAAMALGLALFPKRPQRICAAALLIGVAASNFINPPYSFPFEDNLSFVDFARLQYSAASYLERTHPDSRILTMWPLTVELGSPELGFVGHKFTVLPVASLTQPDLRSVDWNRVQVAVAFSRDWDPSFSFMHFGAVEWFWERFFQYVPGGRRAQVRETVPLRLETRLERDGQWVDIYVNPLSPGPPPVVRASAPEAEAGLRPRGEHSGAAAAQILEQ
jgi:hypothetical protein